MLDDVMPGIGAIQCYLPGRDSIKRVLRHTELCIFSESIAFLAYELSLRSSCLGLTSETVFSCCPCACAGKSVSRLFIDSHFSLIPRCGSATVKPNSPATAKPGT